MFAFEMRAQGREERGSMDKHKDRYRNEARKIDEFSFLIFEGTIYYFTC